MKDLEEKLKLRKNQEPLFAYLCEETLRLLLKFYLEIEDYAKCILIRDTVLNHNKATGSALKIDV